MQGVHRSVHQANHEVASGVGCLVRLEAQQAAATSATPADTGRGAQVVNMQQMVNQLQAEQDALSQELRRSRVPKDATSWVGDAHPDLSSIPPLPDDHQAIEEWMNSRNRHLRDALEFGSADVISQVSNMLAQGAAKLAARRASALALQEQSTEVQTLDLGSRMTSSMHRTPSEGVSTLEVIEKSVHVDGELSEVRSPVWSPGRHPGPASSSARLQAQQVSPTVVDSPPPSVRLDSRRFGERI